MNDKEMLARLEKAAAARDIGAPSLQEAIRSALAVIERQAQKIKELNADVQSLFQELCDSEGLPSDGEHECDDYIAPQTGRCTFCPFVEIARAAKVQEGRKEGDANCNDATEPIKTTWRDAAVRVCLRAKGVEGV